MPGPSGFSNTAYQVKSPALYMPKRTCSDALHMHVRHPPRHHYTRWTRTFLSYYCFHKVGRHFDESYSIPPAMNLHHHRLHSGHLVLSLAVLIQHPPWKLPVLGEALSPGNNLTCESSDFSLLWWYVLSFVCPGGLAFSQSMFSCSFALCVFYVSLVFV